MSTTESPETDIIQDVNRVLHGKYTVASPKLPRAIGEPAPTTRRHCLREGLAMPLSLSATQTIPESWPDRHDPLQHATSNTPPLERTHTSNPRVTTPPVLHTVPIGTITIVSVLRSSAWAPDVHGGAQSPKPSESRISGPFVADELSCERQTRRAWFLGSVAFF